MSFLLRILIALALIALLEFYFIKKVHLSVKEYFPGYPDKKLSRITTALIIFFNLYPLFLTGTWIYSVIFNTGRMQLPQNFVFDYLLTYPFWIGIMIIVQSSLFFIILDVAKGIIIIFTRKYKDKIRSIELKIFPFLIIGFTAYVPARVIYDYHSVNVNHIVYDKKNLPDELKDFRLVFISDLQADKYTNRYRLGKFINKVNEQKADLILAAGDFITSTPDYIGLSAEYSGKMKAKYGVYSCVGDHDNWAYREDNAKSIREITSALQDNDVKMINNDRRYFYHKGKKIEVTFVTNTYVEKINAGLLSDLLNGGEKTDLKIFLTHQPVPYLAEQAEKNHYDIFLAGHTHGGQITFLFPFINISPTLFETKYVRGEYSLGNMMLYVTSGLGMSILPIRYNSTPEITLITFTD